MDKYDLQLEDIPQEYLKQYISVFEKAKYIKKLYGGCPPYEFRVPGHTECFYCEECWISALNEVLKLKK